MNPNGLTGTLLQDEPEWIDWDAFAAAGYQWDDKFYHPAVHHPTAFAPDGQFNASGAYNYSPVFKVDLKSGTVTEVTDW